MRGFSKGDDLRILCTRYLLEMSVLKLSRFICNKYGNNKLLAVYRNEFSALQNK